MYGMFVKGGSMKTIITFSLQRYYIFYKYTTEKVDLIII